MLRSRNDILEKLSADISVYSPIIIYGDAGTGKTYFVRQLCDRLCKNGTIRNYKIYPSWEWIDSMIEALSNQNIFAWRQGFSSTDIIVMDDFQYLSGKRASAEELYHILSTVDVPVIIVTSVPLSNDHYPCEDLISYLRSGIFINLNETLTADIEEYLRNSLLDTNIQLTTQATDWLFQQYVPSVAVAKGIVRTLELYQEPTDSIMDIAECKKILMPLLSTPPMLS